MDKSLYNDWREGVIGDGEALRRLLSDLGEVESQIAPLETEKAELRAQISEVLAEMGGRAEADGYRLMLTAPGVSTRYDAKELDQLVDYLLARGDEDIANLILRSRKQSERTGQLRITPPSSNKG